MHCRLLLFLLQSGELVQPVKMSLSVRNLKPAKRMLCFFNVDNTTSILDPTKIVKVIDAEKLKQGGTILVKFGEDEFEAYVEVTR